MPSTKTVKLDKAQNAHLTTIHALYQAKLNAIRTRQANIEANAKARIEAIESDEMPKVRSEYQQELRGFLAFSKHNCTEHESYEGLPDQSCIKVTAPSRAELRRMAKAQEKAAPKAAPPAKKTSKKKPAKKRPRSRKA